jgi:hypothetical protein
MNFSDRIFGFLAEIPMGTGSEKNVRIGNGFASNKKHYIRIPYCIAYIVLTYA